MKRKLATVFVLIVLVPLALVSWLGWTLNRDQSRRAEERAQELMRSTLRSLDGEIRTLLDSFEERLRTEVADEVDRDTQSFPPLNPPRGTLRFLSRRLPGVRQLFVADATTGRLLYPNLMEALDAREDAFLDRTSEPWSRAWLQGASGGGELDRADHGWHTWFWNEGLHLIFWWTKDSFVLGAEVDRIRLVSDIIAALPDTDPLAPGLADGSIRLLDSRGEVLYQWGAYEPRNSDWPAVRQALSRPLAAWSLEYLSRGHDSGVLLGLLPALSAVVTLVLALALYFYRASSREMRLAAQRVSFVNQVSHELKTPLTNIRMYAELLDAELEDKKPRRHLGVIVSESQRLSRLIRNILTFSRRQRGEITLHKKAGVIDQVIAAVIDHFRPAFEENGIEIVLEAGAERPVEFDHDAVEQILGNLLSNVEKYAATGQRVDVISSQNGNAVTVVVADRGPGIPEAERERIFQPFYRLSNALTDGVTGTGIGLAISRDLARLHGGGLELEDKETEGARFRLTLNCPPGSKEGEHA